MKILVTGGAGFIGSHACEYFSQKGNLVIAFDNLSRAKLLKKKSANNRFNWEYLKELKNVRRVTGDVNDLKLLKELVSKVDAVIHTAGQTAVTTSMVHPLEDFHANASGTLTLLEAARHAKKPPKLILCSTNKVYGERVNQVPIARAKTRYRFKKPYELGIPENFGIDLCEHTPYGCSKLTADLYMQDFALAYGIKTGVFRMSCIYGTRQFGVEDQGWLAWFVIAALTNRQLTIYGDGRQVRDVLWVSDLILAYERFLHSKLDHIVVNMGGGSENTLSLLELISLLKEMGLELRYSFSRWRPSDQKVYVSDIRKAKKLLKWSPKVSPAEGLRRLIGWVSEHQVLFR